MTITLLILLLLCSSAHPLCSPSMGADALSASLSLTNTVDAKTTFRIFHRRPENSHWDNGNAYTFTNGVALLRALETSKPTHGHTPSIEITLDWFGGSAERKTNSVALCYGNRLFWHGKLVYQIPEKSYVLVDSLFPKNK